MEHTCRNCGADFNGKFCNTCGQKFDVPRFTFKHILEEGFHAFTHADKSFLSFAFALIVAPGKVAYEYIIERKRKKYFSPFTFFLLIAAISLFVGNLRLKLEDELFHQNNEYGHLFNVYGKALLLAAIPVIALGLWLLPSPKPKLKYSEYTVLSMMLVSLYTMLDMIVIFINYLATAWFKRDVGISSNLLVTIIVIAFMIYGDYGFHKRLGKTSPVRSFFAGIIIEISMALVTIFILWAVVGRFHGIGTLEMWGIRLHSAE